MPRYALKIEYDGNPFRGWQRQAGHPSVQQALEAALRALDPVAPSVIAAGRTDTGVHALGQVAHADLAQPWPADRLRAALNRHLRPQPVAVVAVARVRDAFHARFSAIERAYLYRIVVRAAPPVAGAGRIWHRRHRLDADAMRSAARHLTGHHDFTTFRASQCQARSPLKTLDDLAITEHSWPHGGEYRFALRARSFLHHQVRSIVGTLERVGAGTWTPDDVAGALDARDRAACGPVAPPQGLCLTSVTYPEDPFASPDAAT